MSLSVGKSAPINAPHLHSVWQSSVTFMLTSFHETDLKLWINNFTRSVTSRTKSNFHWPKRKYKTMWYKKDISKFVGWYFLNSYFFLLYLPKLYAFKAESRASMTSHRWSLVCQWKIAYDCQLSVLSGDFSMCWTAEGLGHIYRRKWDRLSKYSQSIYQILAIIKWGELKMRHKRLRISPFCCFLHPGW